MYFTVNDYWATHSAWNRYHNLDPPEDANEAQRRCIGYIHQTHTTKTAPYNTPNSRLFFKTITPTDNLDNTDYTDYTDNTTIITATKRAQNELLALLSSPPVPTSPERTR